jgi:hypothetical protein
MREWRLRQRGAAQIALQQELGGGRLGGRQLVVVVPARPPLGIIDASVPAPRQGDASEVIWQTISSQLPFSVFRHY